MTAVTEPGPRIVTLDIIRGVAVMGIFGVNVIAFAMPAPAYFNPSAYGMEGPADLALWFATFILIDGKMRGLFSMLFGASMLLVMERAEAAGQSAASVHYRRMIWLLFFGCVHYYLIWFGDILTLYAAVGMIAFFFRKRSVRALIYWAIGFLILDLLFVGSGAWQFSVAEAAAHAPGASRQAVERWNAMSEGFAPMSADALARNLARYQGSYAGILGFMFGDGAVGPLFQFLFGSAETLGYMLLGMAGLKSGFLKGEWPDRTYRRIALITLAVSIPAFALLGWLNWRSGFAVPVFFLIFFVLTNPFRLAMIFGYASLIILLSRNGGPLAQRIAATGRAAFTNYLGTSLIAVTIFYGFGLGLYGHLSRIEAWLFAPAMWVVMLLWSKPWLDRFRYGPFEWLWRSLARWSPQPMRKGSPATAPALDAA
jgi:uncharacterized protein